MMYPCFMIIIYRAYQFFFTDYEKGKRVRHKYANLYDVFNPFIWNYAKEIRVDDHKKNDDVKQKEDNYIRPDIFDKLFKIKLLYLIIHYNFANLAKLHECGFNAIWSSPCKFWEFMHHLIAPILLKAAFMMDHYPIYLMFPLLYHPFIIVHPGQWCHKWLQGGAFFIHNHYPLIFLKEYRQNKVYISAIIALYLVAGTGLMIDIVYPCNTGFIKENYASCWSEPEV